MRKPIAALACAAFILAACQSKGDTAKHRTNTAPPRATATAPAPATPKPRTATGAQPSPAIVAYMDREEADLRARLRAAGVSVTRSRDRIVVIMQSDAAFAANSEKVQPQFYQVLAMVSEVLTRYDRTSVAVSGHTDSAAGERGEPLSRKQADAVAAVLKQQGVVQQRLRTEGLGKARPIATNATSAGRAKNRRVEIQIIPFAQ
jgi:outer membrane protein OmpA-like peptidoglycan-associated protein